MKQIRRMTAAMVLGTVLATGAALGAGPAVAAVDSITGMTPTLPIPQQWAPGHAVEHVDPPVTV